MPCIKLPIMVGSGRTRQTGRKHLSHPIDAGSSSVTGPSQVYLRSVSGLFLDGLSSKPKSGPVLLGEELALAALSFKPVL